MLASAKEYETAGVRKITTDRWKRIIGHSQPIEIVHTANDNELIARKFKIKLGIEFNKIL